jgi:hypothetical protein
VAMVRHHFCVLHAISRLLFDLIVIWDQFFRRCDQHRRPDTGDIHHAHKWQCLWTWRIFSILDVEFVIRLPSSSFERVANRIYTASA